MDNAGRRVDDRNRIYQMEATPMGFWARIFGTVPVEKRVGLHIAGSELWQIKAVSNASLFLRALPTLIPDTSAVLYIEDTTEDSVREFLEKCPADAKTKIAVGTIWPRPDRHHLRMQIEHLQDFAALIDSQSTGYLCSHLHVYQNDRMLLQWYDAWFDPILICTEIAEDNVARFAKALQRPYCKIRNPG